MVFFLAAKLETLCTRGARRIQTTPRQRTTIRPRLEALEDRTLPSFMAPVDYPIANYLVDSAAAGVAAGDFANNGIQDLAVANAILDRVTVFTGNGAGTFQATLNSYIPSEEPFRPSVAVGDVTGDGKLDIVTTSYYYSAFQYTGVGSVSVMVGNGDGTFLPPVSFRLPDNEQPESLALGDMNRDGRLDAIVNVDGQIDVLLGNGDGTLSLASSTPQGGFFNASVADFDGDGNLDVATATSSGAVVLLGNGDGTLGPPTNIGAGVILAAADLNGDGKPDLVTGKAGESSVSLWFGNGNGTFQAPLNIATLAPADAAVVADFNSDGKMDLAVANDMLLGDGEGSFTDVPIAPYVGRNTIAADFNSDGYPDLAMDGALTGYPDGNAGLAVLLNAADWSTPATSSRFSVSGFPSSTTAGSPESFTVTALNADGSVDNGYIGRVNFTSSDGQADLPAAYTFTAADKGAHNFNATLKSAGTKSITVTDISGTLTGSETGITVTPAAASNFAIRAPASGTAGSAFGVTVTALDPYNNTDTSYTGTIHFTSSDGQASLPGDYSFTAGEAGVHTFTDGVTLKAGGDQTVTATDTVNSSITGAATVSVNGAAPAAITVSGFPSSTTAGTPGSFTVTARNADGSIDTGYTGTVTFRSSDGQAALPASYTFTAADAGKHIFSATLKSAGTQSITVADAHAPDLTGSEMGIAVTPAAASTFVLSAPANVTAGVPFSLTVTVEDAYGNTVTDYTGTIHFTSSQRRKTLPANYTFTAGDAGVHTFTGLVLKTTGNQTITVTDTHNRRVTGSTGIDVLAAVKQPKRRH